MTSSIHYLLPGEQDKTSSIVHNHGKNSNEQFLTIPRIYEPKEKDLIIGIVIVRTQDLFLVDINSNEPAVLPITSFDNGRIPNRNQMNRLSVVYAHVVRNDSWAQTELSCQSIDSSKNKSDFGVINDGHIIRCSLYLCEKLQRTNLINQIRRLIKNFQIRITKNGFIWYQTDSLNSMIIVKNIFYEHEFNNDINQLINHYQIFMDKFQKQDDNFVQVKQKIVKRDVEVKKSVQQQQQQQQPISNNNNNNNTAVDRLLKQVIKDILDKIIDEIEKNENN